MNLDIGVAYNTKSGNRLKIEIGYFDKMDQYYVHIREFMMDGDTGAWFRTAKGYAILAEEVDSVITLLQVASDKLTERFYAEQKQLKFEFME